MADLMALTWKSLIRSMAAIALVAVLAIALVGFLFLAILSKTSIKLETTVIG